jgi:hypothetical protein
MQADASNKRSDLVDDFHSYLLWKIVLGCRPQKSTTASAQAQQERAPTGASRPPPDNLP